jgi:uncharacterized protein
MNKDYSPRRLDVVHFAKSNAQLSGVTPLVQMSRLYNDLDPVPRDSDLPYGVHWRASGWMEPGNTGQTEQAWLGVVAQARIPQICQRCTGLLAYPIDLDYRYRFVSTEKEAAEQDEWAEEDVLVVSKAFDLVQLIEDELLMAMPLIPVHERCDVQLPTEAMDAAFQEQAEHTNPFEALKEITKNRA